MTIKPGRIAVVTGASRGIGAATAVALAAAGARVALLARSKDKLDQVAGQIRDAGGEALTVTVDVTNLEEVTAARDEVVRAWGTPTLLVNNAAVVEPLARTWEADPAAVRRNADINFTGAFHVLHAFVPGMLDEGHGRIVGVSSGAGANHIPTMGVYGATKGAFEHLHRTAAVELADSPIRVNVLWPGGVDTEMQAQLRTDDFAFVDMAKAVHDQGKLRTPEQIAPTIVELCDDQLTKHGELVNLAASAA